MKTLLACMGLVIASVANGQTAVPIQNPTVAELLGFAPCAWTANGPAPSIVIGFDGTGGHIETFAKGTGYCSNTSPRYHYYCMKLTFDLFGHFVCAVNMPPTKPYWCNYSFNVTATYFNVSGYEAYTTAVPASYGPPTYFPALRDP
jgi:hypothetical protein